MFIAVDFVMNNLKLLYTTEFNPLIRKLGDLVEIEL